MSFVNLIIEKEGKSLKLLQSGLLSEPIQNLEGEYEECTRLWQELEEHIETPRVANPTIDDIVNQCNLDITNARLTHMAETPDLEQFTDLLDFLTNETLTQSLRLQSVRQELEKMETKLVEEAVDCSKLDHRPILSMLKQMGETVQYIQDLRDQLQIGEKSMLDKEQLYIKTLKSRPKHSYQILTLKDRITQQANDILVRTGSNIIGTENNMDFEKWASEWYYNCRYELEKSMEAALDGRKQDYGVDHLLKLSSNLSDICEQGKSLLNQMDTLKQNIPSLDKLQFVKAQVEGTCSEFENLFVPLWNHCESDFHKLKAKSESTQHTMRLQNLQLSQLLKKSVDMLKENEVDQQKLWDKVLETQDELQQLAEYRFQLVNSQLESLDKLLKEQAECQAFLKSIELHELKLRKLKRQLQQSLEYKDLIAKLARTVLKDVTDRRDDLLDKMKECKNRTLDSWKNHHTKWLRLWIDGGGTILSQQINYVETLDQLMYSTNKQLEFCKDTNDPNERINLVALQLLRTMRQEASEAVNILSTQLVTVRAADQCPPGADRLAIEQLSDLQYTTSRNVETLGNSTIVKVAGIASLSPIAIRNSYAPKQSPTKTLPSVRPNWMTKHDIVSPLDESVPKKPISPSKPVAVTPARSNSFEISNPIHPAPHYDKWYQELEDMSGSRLRPQLMKPNPALRNNIPARLPSLDLNQIIGFD